MNLVNTVKDQMASALCCFRNPLPCFAVLAPLIFLISAGFTGLGFSFLFLSSTVFILSTIFFTFSKHKPGVAEKREENTGSEQESSPQMEDVSEAEPESETQIQKDKSEEGILSEIHDHLVTSPYHSLPESEWQYKYYLSTSEESEVEWPFRENLDQSPDCSDIGSISDEESLIEIALPSGQYVGDHNEVMIKTKDNKQQKVPDLSPESIFQPHCLMELLSEMNDEDNLIEIDISMGSIKCSRFEIQA